MRLLPCQVRGTCGRETAEPMTAYRSFYAVLAVAAVLAGCRSSGTAFNPPQGIFLAHGLVVTDVSNDAVLTFPLGGSGTTAVAPSATLSGAATQLDQPEGFFVDRAHAHLWVANYSSGSAGTVTEYALSAHGDTAPLASIGGTTTTIQGPGGIYVDGHGNVYVGDYEAGNVDVFDAGATGDVAPTRQITGISAPSGVWLDSSGDLWVGEAEAGELLEFAPNASGAATPKATITSTALSFTMGVFIDAHQNVWAVDCTGTGATPNVLEFAAGSTGSGVTPTVDISGSNTGLTCPNGVVVDSSGNIYVADYGAAAVYEFAAGANGNVAPIRTIPAGSTTTLAKPLGVIVY